MIKAIVIHWKHIVTVETDFPLRKCFNETDQLQSGQVADFSFAKKAVKCWTRFLCCTVDTGAHVVEQEYDNAKDYGDENGNESGVEVGARLV